MNSIERHELRYKRRCIARNNKKQQRADTLGGAAETMSFDKLYKAGKKCCLGVRWKQSTQRFEMHLFSKTAVATRKIRESKWIPGKYNSFLLRERGKTRPIDAPNIQDRQIHKAYTQNVLLPLYLPGIIWNNGASLRGKGFAFSKKMLVRDLHSFYRRYKTNGSVILLDFKQFFPLAPHEAIIDRHKRLLLDEQLKQIGDLIVSSNGKDYGMPLGVEPSQAEMIALPSSVDNYIKCQLGIKYMGHYMDDYYILVPPNQNAKETMQKVIEKAKEIGLTVSASKTKIQPICKPFKYCKAKYTLTQSGRVIVNGNRKSVYRARRKIKAFKGKIDSGMMGYEELRTSINGVLAYFKSYNNHNRILKLSRLFYTLFGFLPDRTVEYRLREGGIVA